MNRGRRDPDYTPYRPKPWEDPSLFQVNPTFHPTIPPTGQHALQNQLQREPLFAPELPPRRPASERSELAQDFAQCTISDFGRLEELRDGLPALRNEEPRADARTYSRENVLRGRLDPPRGIYWNEAQMRDASTIDWDAEEEYAERLVRGTNQQAQGGWEDLFNWRQSSGMVVEREVESEPQEHGSAEQKSPMMRPLSYDPDDIGEIPMLGPDNLPQVKFARRGSTGELTEQIGNTRDFLSRASSYFAPAKARYIAPQTPDQRPIYHQPVLASHTIANALSQPKKAKHFGKAWDELPPRSPVRRNVRPRSRSLPTQLDTGQVNSPTAEEYNSRSLLRESPYRVRELISGYHKRERTGLYCDRFWNDSRRRSLPASARPEGGLVQKYNRIAQENEASGINNLIDGNHVQRPLEPRQKVLDGITLIPIPENARGLPGITSKRSTAAAIKEDYEKARYSRMRSADLDKFRLPGAFPPSVTYPSAINTTGTTHHFPNASISSESCDSVRGTERGSGEDAQLQTGGHHEPSTAQTTNLGAVDKVPRNSEYITNKRGITADMAKNRKRSHKQEEENSRSEPVSKEKSRRSTLDGKPTPQQGYFLPDDSSSSGSSGGSSGRSNSPEIPGSFPQAGKNNGKRTRDDEDGDGTERTSPVTKKSRRRTIEGKPIPKQGFALPDQSLLSGSSSSGKSSSSGSQSSRSASEVEISESRAWAQSLYVATDEARPVVANTSKDGRSDDDTGSISSLDSVVGNEAAEMANLLAQMQQAGGVDINLSENECNQASIARQKIQESKTNASSSSSSSASKGSSISPPPIDPSTSCPAAPIVQTSLSTLDLAPTGLDPWSTRFSSSREELDHWSLEPNRAAIVELVESLRTDTWVLNPDLQDYEWKIRGINGDEGWGEEVVQALGEFRREMAEEEIGLELEELEDREEGRTGSDEMREQEEETRETETVDVEMTDVAGEMEASQHDQSTEESQGSGNTQVSGRPEEAAVKAAMDGEEALSTNASLNARCITQLQSSPEDPMEPSDSSSSSVQSESSENRESQEKRELDEQLNQPSASELERGFSPELRVYEDGRSEGIEYEEGSLQEKGDTSQKEIIILEDEEASLGEWNPLLGGRSNTPVVQGTQTEPVEGARDVDSRNGKSGSNSTEDSSKENVENRRASSDKFIEPNSQQYRNPLGEIERTDFSPTVSSSASQHGNNSEQSSLDFRRIPSLQPSENAFNAKSPTKLPYSFINYGMASRHNNSEINSLTSSFDSRAPRLPPPQGERSPAASRSRSPSALPERMQPIVIVDSSPDSSAFDLWRANRQLRDEKQTFGGKDGEFAYRRILKWMEETEESGKVEGELREILTNEPNMDARRRRLIEWSLQHGSLTEKFLTRPNRTVESQDAPSTILEPNKDSHRIDLSEHEDMVRRYADFMKESFSRSEHYKRSWRVNESIRDLRNDETMHTPSEWESVKTALETPKVDCEKAAKVMSKSAMRDYNAHFIPAQIEAKGNGKYKFKSYKKVLAGPIARPEMKKPPSPPPSPPPPSRYHIESLPPTTTTIYLRRHPPIHGAYPRRSTTLHPTRFNNISIALHDAFCLLTIPYIRDDQILPSPLAPSHSLGTIIATKLSRINTIPTLLSFLDDILPETAVRLASYLESFAHNGCIVTKSRGRNLLAMTRLLDMKLALVAFSEKIEEVRKYIKRFLRPTDNLCSIEEFALFKLLGNWLNDSLSHIEERVEYYIFLVQSKELNHRHASDWPYDPDDDNPMSLLTYEVRNVRSNNPDVWDENLTEVEVHRAGGPKPIREPAQITKELAKRRPEIKNLQTEGRKQADRVNSMRNLIKSKKVTGLKKGSDQGLRNEYNSMREKLAKIKAEFKVGSQRLKELSIELKNSKEVWEKRWGGNYVPLQMWRKTGANDGDSVEEDSSDLEAGMSDGELSEGGMSDEDPCWEPEELSSAE